MKYSQHHHFATDKHEPPQMPMARVINWLSKRGTASALKMGGAEGQSQTDTGCPTGF
jgi:hypothetical protein